MIREPYGVYPYNTTIDLAEKKDFSFIFNGDQLRQYDYEIIENNNKKNIFKKFNSLKNLENTFYNDTTVNFPIEIDQAKANNKNLIWRLRLVENKGDWTEGNIPTMPVQNGQIQEIISENTVKGILAGTLENLSTEDLQEICLSLKTDSNIPYRVTDYESKYYEYYTLGKGGYFLGEIKKEGSENTYYWIQKTVIRDEEEPVNSWVTRSSVNKDLLLLKDDTGVYSIDTLFTETEFNEIFKNSTVEYSKEEALGGIEAKILESFGYNEKAQKIYNVYSVTSIEENRYSNKITRASVGLSPYLYVQYKKENADKYTEEALQDAFTEQEFTTLKGYSITYQLYNQDDKTAHNYTEILETSFNEEDEILYSIEENLINYGTKLLSQYNKGEITAYPVETTVQLLREKKFPEKASILIKDQNGNIFSSEYLFTKSEVDSIEDLNYGLYTIQPFEETVNLNEEKNFYVYKNFYDTNYYYFQARNKPQVTFVDENRRELEIVDNTLNIDSRYFAFGVKEQDNINTKFYNWILYRDDQIKPIVETEKTFSQNINFVYENFLNNYSYTLILHLETQDNANYDYVLNNIVVHYDETVKVISKANAIYDKDNGCTVLTWPTQKLSIPTVIPEDGYFQSQDWLDEEDNSAAIELKPGTSFTYDDIVGEMFKIDPNNFILSVAFTIPEEIKNNTPSTFDLIRLSSLDDQAYLTIRKDNLSLKVITPKTPLDGVEFYEITFEELEGGILGQTIQKNSILSFLKIINEYGFKAPYVKEEHYYDYFTLPNRDNFVYENNYDLYGADTNLNKSRYKLFLSKQGAFLVKYKFNGLEWYTSNYYVIDNGDSNNKYDFKNAYFNKIQLFGPAIFKYITIYTLSDIRELITNLEPDCLDMNWSPSWDNIPDDKIFSVDFAEDIKSSYNIDFDGTIKSYRVYRNEYSDEKMSELIDNKLVAEFNVADLNKINNNNDFIIKDYTAHNRGWYIYSITPRIETEDEDYKVTKVLGKSIDSNLINIDEYYWFFVSLGKREDGTYAPIEKWKFYLNLSEGSLSHNIQKVFHTGFSAYPKASIGMTNYITTTLSCLVGDFQYQTNKVYKGVYTLNEQLYQASSKDNLTRLFVPEIPLLEDMDVANDNITITLHVQTRKVINYGFYYQNGVKKYYIDVDDPFIDFIPGIDFKNFSLIIIKDKNNENNYTQVGQYNTYTDNINIVNKWNNFVNTDNPILIKDIKGNCFIGALSNNIEAYNNRIDQMPTTINFNVTQIDNINNYIVFDY